MATGGSAASSEWRPKATKVPQRVCSCSGYVHTHATTAALKCQLEVQLCAKNRLPPRGKKAHRFDMEAKGKKESKWGVRIRWHEVVEGSIKRGKFSPRSEEETPNEWRHSVAFLPCGEVRTVKEKFFFSSDGVKRSSKNNAVALKSPTSIGICIRCWSVTSVNLNILQVSSKVLYYWKPKKKKKGKNENEN